MNAFSTRTHGVTSIRPTSMRRSKTRLTAPYSSLGVRQHRLELYAEPVDSLEQWFEVDLVIHVTRGHGEGEGHLRLDAAGGVHPVSEDEDSPASADAGFGCVWCRWSLALVLSSLFL